MRSAARTAPAAYWASWADSVGMFRQRRRDAAASVAAALTDPPHTCSPFARAADSRGFLHSVGCETAEWAALADGLRPRQPGVPTHGWQFFAARAVDISSPLPSCPGCLPLSLPFCVLSLVPWRASLSPWCLLPHLLGFALSSSVFSSFVASPLPFSHLPVWPSTRHLWPSPCSVLEGGGPWKSWVRVGEWPPGSVGKAEHAPVPLTDSRRLELVRWVASVQLALDTTLVSPVCSNGEPQCCGGWGSSVECTSTEGSHSPGIMWSTQSRSPGCSRRRDRRPFVRGCTQFPVPVGQSKGAVSSPHPACAASRAFALSLLDRRPAVVLTV